MKKVIFVVGAAVIIGLGASVLLVPGAREIALMQFKDKRFEEARVAYEQQLAAGSLNIEVVSTLTKLYLQVGEVDKAIEVMEKYVAANPTDISARKELGTLYQYAQRSDDYVRNLEEINRLQPSATQLAQLSDIYNFSADYTKQVETLKALIQSEQGSNPNHYVDLANILAAQKQYPEAIDILKQLRTTRPDAVTFAQTQLLVSLLLDTKQTEEAATIAKEWQAKTQNMEEVAQLVDMLLLRGNPEAAKAMMAAYTEEQIAASPALLKEKIIILIVSGQENEAYALLTQLHKDGKLLPELREKLLTLAVARGDKPVINAMLDEIDLNSLSESQLIALAELSFDGDPLLTKRLQQTVLTPDQEQAKPILAAILALATKDKTVDDKLTALNQNALNNEQRLLLARHSWRAGRKDWTEKFLAGLPPVESLSDAEVAAVGELYLQLRVYDKGAALLEKTAARNSPALELLRVKFAALRGDEKTVQAWLDANPTVDVRTLNDLYFAAYEAKKYALAARLAEKLIAIDDSPKTRNMLAYAFFKVGRYEDTVKLLRGNQTATADTENTYIQALAKLAPKSAEYRNELVQYVSKRLRDNIPEKQKMALVYALIDAKQIGPALPVIRDFALKHGGKWAYLYAEELDKQGRYEESREFWVKLADQPTTSMKDRRAIGYMLLDHGYKADGERIFADLAQTAPADSADVKQLLYLWGPRLKPEQVTWLSARMRASTGSERAKFAGYIADSTPAEDLPALAEEIPELLNEPEVARRYAETIARLPYQDALINAEIYAREQGNYEVLYQLGNVWTEQGKKREALGAYTKLAQLKPDITPVMLKIAQLNYGIADYSASEMYLKEYLEANEPGAPEDWLDAHYMSGELLRRQQQPESPAAYGQALKAANAVERKTADTYSKIAQSQIYFGDVQGGLETYQKALAAYPNDKLLRADAISALIELKRYKEAKALLASTPAEAPLAPQALNPMPLNDTVLTSYQTFSNQEEMVLHLNHPGGQVAVLPKNVEASYPWVSYVSEGYDTLLVAAKPGVQLTLQRNDQGLILVPDMPAADPSTDMNRQIALRYELLQARIDLETGHTGDAIARIQPLLEQYPNDTQLLGYAGNALVYAGNPYLGRQYLVQAQAMAPNNEDVALLLRDVNRLHGPSVKLDHEWAKRGNDQEHITTASIVADVDTYLRVGANAQNNNIKGRGVRRADGRFGNFSDDKQRAEIYGIYSLYNGDFVQGSLFANNDTLGGGLYYTWLNPIGETRFTAEWHRPYWEYIQGVFDDATRDRLSIYHIYKPESRWSFGLGPNVNRYNVKQENNVASTWGVEGNVTYRIYDAQPFLAVSYGFDGEYYLNKELRTTLGGEGYKPFEFDSHEIHFISLIGGYEFDESTYGEMMVGYGFDRLGGDGPSVEAKVTHELNDNIDAQLRAFYGLDTGDTDNNITRVGGYVRWRF